jgi:hypothetical protein
MIVLRKGTFSIAIDFTVLFSPHYAWNFPVARAVL